MSETAENLPENAFDLLIEDLEAIYKSNPTKGIARTHKCEIHKLENGKKFQIVTLAPDGKEEIFFVNLEHKTVHKHIKDKKGVNQRYDFLPQMWHPNNDKYIAELRDKLAKFTF